MRALDAIQSTPWLITEEALATIVSIATREHLDTVLADALRAERADLLATRSGEPLEGTRSITTRNGVGIVPITGPIFRYANLFTRYSGGTSTGQLAQDIQTALDDGSVTSLLLHIDSPGGQATGINELASAIYAGRGRKPIAAYVEGMGASAAYWLAAAADTIIIDATATLGSIGAILTVTTPGSGGRSVEIVSSQSPRKRADVTTEEGRSQFQRLADDMAAVFIERVAQYRGVDEGVVLSDFGQGGLLVGRGAVEARLADRLGSFEETLARLARRTDQRRAWLRPAAYEGYTAMDWKALWGGFFAAAKEEGADMPNETPTPAMASTAPPAPAVTAAAPDVAALEAQYQAKLADAEAAHQREIAQLRERERTQAADGWVKQQLVERRALPAEASALTALYTQLSADDAADSGTRLQMLDAAMQQRPQHTLAAELIPNDQDVKTLPAARTSSDAPDADRVAELAGKTAEGRAALQKGA